MLALYIGLQLYHRRGELNRNLSPQNIHGQGGTYHVCIAPVSLTGLREAGVLAHASTSNGGRRLTSYLQETDSCVSVPVSTSCMSPLSIESRGPAINVSKHDECRNNHAHTRTTLGVQSTARYAQHAQGPGVPKHVCRRSCMIQAARQYLCTRDG